MFPRGHAGIAMVLNSILILILSPEPTTASLGSVLVITSSIVPDTDMASTPLNLEHRGLTHTIWFCITLSTLIFLALNVARTYTLLNTKSIFYATVATLIGSLSHLFSDALNGRIDIISVNNVIEFDLELGSSIIRSESVYYNNVLFIIGSILNVITVFYVF